MLLATIDVEDVATPKIKAVKDALTDLATGGPGLDGTSKSISGMSSALDDAALSARAAQQALLQHAQAIQQAAKMSATLEDATSRLDQAIIQHTQHLDQNSTAIKNFVGLMSLMVQSATTGTGAIEDQAVAMRALAEQAKAGVGGSQQFAAQLKAYADQLTKGIPLTKDQTEALGGMLAQTAKANKEVLGLTESAEKQESAFGKLKVASLAIGLALGELGREAFSYAKEAANDAARTEVLGTVMTVMAKNASLGSVALQAQIEKIKGLGITTQEATNSVIKFVQAQLDVSKASQLARVAQDLAVVAGVNSSVAFERLTHAIEATSVMQLRQFGIVTNLRQVYAEYAATLGKTAQQLDEGERKQAFLNLILQEGAKFAGTYEAAMGDVGKQMTSLDRLFEEARDKIGEQFLPVLRLVVGTTYELLEAFNKADPVIQKIAASLVAMGAVLGILGGLLAGAQFLGILEIFEKAGTVIAYLTVGLEGAEATAVAGMGAFEGLVAILGGPFTATLIAVIALLTAAAGAWVLLSGNAKHSVDEIREEMGKAKATVDSFNQSLLALADSATTAKQAQGFSGQGEVQGLLASKALDDYNQKLKAVKETIGPVILLFDEQTKRYVAVAEKTRDVIAAEEKIRDLQKELGEEISKTNDEIADVNEQLKELATRADIAAKAHGNLAEAARLADEAMKDDKDAILGNTSVWQDLWTIVKNVTSLLVDDFLMGIKVVIKMLQETVVELVHIHEELVIFAAKLLGIAPPAWVLNALKVLAKVLAIDLAEGIHQTASETTAMTDAMNPKKIDEQTAALIKQRGGLEALNKQYKAMKDESEGQSLAIRAQENARTQIFTDAATVTQKTKEIVEAGGKTLLDELNNMTRKATSLEISKGLADTKGQIALTADEFGKLPDQIEEKLSAHTAKLAKLGQEATKYYNQLLGGDEQFAMKTGALAKALAVTADSTADYNNVLNAAAPLLKKWSTLSDEARDKLHLSAAAMQVLDAGVQETYSRANTALIEKYNQELAKGQEALSNETAKAALASNKQFAQQQLQAEQQIAQEREKTSDQVRQMEQDNYQRVAVSAMSSVDQQLYAEHKRVDDIIHNIDKERAARDRDFAAQQKQIALTEQAQTEAVQQEYDALSRKRDIEDADFEHHMQQEVALQHITQDFANQQIQISRQASIDYAQMLDSQQEKRQAVVHQEAANNQTILDGKRQAAAENDAIIDQQVQYTITASGIIVQRILRDNNLMYQALKGIFVTVASSISEAFAGIITGTKSVKQALIDIWTSLKNELFTIFDSILKRWIENAVLMSTANGGFSPSSFMQNLVGQQGRSYLGSLMGGGSSTSMASSALPLILGGGGAAAGGVSLGVPAAVSGDTIGMTEGGLMLPAAGSGGAAAGMSAGQIAMGSFAGAAVGGMVGYGVGSATGSKTAGALSGAASGALTGFMVGGPIGAGVGAVVGLVAGLIGGAKKARAEMQAVNNMRGALIDTYGGVAALKDAADKAGVSFDDLMSTKKVKDFQEALNKLQVGKFAEINGGLQDLWKTAREVGIDLGDAFTTVGRSTDQVKANLDLLQTKLNLIKGNGGLEGLRKEAQLLHFDLNTLFQAKSIDDYNAALAVFNQKLQEAQDRIAGITAASAGLAQEIEGFAKGADLDKIAKSERFDKSGTPIFAGNQALSDVNKQVASFGATAENTFLSYVHETGDVVGALSQVGPALDQIIAIEDKLHITTGDANTEWLVGLRRIMNENPQLVEQIVGLQASIEGLTKAKREDQGQFDRDSHTALGLYDQLIAKTGDSKSALALMQPVLQDLWNAQQKFGLQTDEATKKLIDMGIQSGFINTDLKPDTEDLVKVMGDLRDVMKEIRDYLLQIKKNATDAGTAIGNMPQPNDPNSPQQHGGGTPPIPPAPGVPPPGHGPNTGPGGSTPPTGGVQPHAMGGLVPAYSGPYGYPFLPQGPDSVPAMLEPYEYVQPSDVTRFYGVTAMDAVRRKRAVILASGGGGFTIGHGGVVLTPIGGIGIPGGTPAPSPSSGGGSFTLPSRGGVGGRPPVTPSAGDPVPIFGSGPDTGGGNYQPTHIVTPGPIRTSGGSTTVINNNVSVKVSTINRAGFNEEEVADGIMTALTNKMNKQDNSSRAFVGASRRVNVE